MNRLVVQLPIASIVTLLGLIGCSKVSTPAPQASDEENSAKTVRMVVRAQEAEERKPSKEGTAPSSGSFNFPEDEGGTLLARALTPRVSAGPLPDRVGPYRPLPAPPEFTAPLPPLPNLELEAPRLPIAKPSKGLRPHLVSEEGLSAGTPAPTVPQRPSFLTDEKARVPSVDVRIPPPLPTLATPVPDRASLEDATTEASTEAVSSAPLPTRTTPVPFQKTTLPDPFENRKPLSTPVPSEEGNPASGVLQLGRPGDK